MRNPFTRLAAYTGATVVAVSLLVASPATANPPTPTDTITVSTTARKSCTNILTSRDRFTDAGQTVTARAYYRTCWNDDGDVWAKVRSMLFTWQRGTPPRKTNCDHVTSAYRGAHYTGYLSDQFGANYRTGRVDIQCDPSGYDEAAISLRRSPRLYWDEDLPAPRWRVTGAIELDWGIPDIDFSMGRRFPLLDFVPWRQAA